MPENMNPRDREEWFLAQLEQENRDVPSLLKWISNIRSAGAEEEARSFAELLQETLQTEGRVEEALGVLKLRAAWHGDDSPFRSECEEQSLRILGSSPENRVLVRNVGFDGNLDLTECFRRLDVLRALKPEVLCYDGTWGAGVVRSVDWFYKRVNIDFEKKSGHHMSFAYAGETLEILDDDHLLARRHNDPAALSALIKEDPAEVVRITLRSFGPLPLPLLQEQLVPGIIAEGDWKRFWDSARKDLKKDPLVEIPARRSEPICLLDEEKSYDERWFRALANERNMGKILKEVEAFIAAGDFGELTEAQEDIFGDRLAFLIKGAEGNHAGWVARAVAAACNLGLSEEYVGVAVYLDRFLEPGSFLATVGDLPAREVSSFLLHLRRHDPERTASLLLGLLPQLEIGVLNEAMELLVANGYENACAGIYRDLTVEKEVADVEILYWLCRNEDRMETWSLGGLPDLARWIIRALEEDHSGEHLKAENQLRTRFEQDEWLKKTLEAMDDGQRCDLVRRINEGSAWKVLERRSLLGKIIKRYPEMGNVLVSKSGGRESKTVGTIVTAHSSYRKRQIQLERIVRTEIHEVSREIAKARSYGDLSENHEYKAAKEKQEFLFKRRAELEEMLQKVQPTDFEGYPAEQAGQGTGVSLQYDDERSEQYFILGVWDRDEKLGVISPDSRMAEALKGCRAGDQITVPSEDGEKTCTVREITGLTDEIREWIAE